jgi:hypothetical protein
MTISTVVSEITIPILTDHESKVNSTRCDPARTGTARKATSARITSTGTPSTVARQPG